MCTRRRCLLLVVVLSLFLGCGSGGHHGTLADSTREDRVAGKPDQLPDGASSDGDTASPEDLTADLSEDGDYTSPDLAADISPDGDQILPEDLAADLSEDGDQILPEDLAADISPDDDQILPEDLAADISPDGAGDADPDLEGEVTSLSCAPGAAPLGTRECKDEQTARECLTDGNWQETPCVNGDVCLAGRCRMPIPTPPSQPGLLVKFGTSEATSVTPYGDWTQILRHPQYTTFVAPDGNPDHTGITATANAPGWNTVYFGIKGTTPIAFKRGHRIVATFYNSSTAVLVLTGRISFTDADEPPIPDNAVFSSPWNTIYRENTGHVREVQPESLATLVLNITDAQNIVAPNALPTEGDHTLINITLAPYNAALGQLILTRIELTNAADFTPPLAPTNLVAEPVVMSQEAGTTALKLSWAHAADVPGPAGETSEIDRYLIYRDGKLHASVSPKLVAEARLAGKPVSYIDLTVAPNTTYTYAVTAVDAAVTGTYRVWGSDRNNGNEGPPAVLTVTTPPFQSNTLINPHAALTFLGAFRLPKYVDGVDNSGWAYASQGLAAYPGGNPEKLQNELPGSLFGVGHIQSPQISEVSIPTPVISMIASELPRARVLTPFTKQIWPAVYNGSWQPPGGADVYMGIGFHPGGNGVGPHLYYGIYNAYSSFSLKAHGAITVDISPLSILQHVPEDSIGAWYLGGPPGDAGNVSPWFTDKLIFKAPQAWADQYTGGRSLIVGQGYQSGVGVPTHGPALYAIAPWEGATPQNPTLPGDESVISAVQLLQYGSDEDTSKWNTNWSLSIAYTGGAWFDVNGRMAVVVSFVRPKGDTWYGGEDGSLVATSDNDLPVTRTSQLRGPMATEYEASLYFYNPADLARVINKQMQPWEPKPYMVLDFKHLLVRGSKESLPYIGAIAYDYQNGYLYLIEQNADDSEGSKPYNKRCLIYVWKVGTP